KGAFIKAFVINNFGETRKFIDATCAEVEVQTANKVYWFRLDENGEFVGGISKFLQEKKAEIISALSLVPGDFVAVAANTKKTDCYKTAGAMRKLFGQKIPAIFDKEQYAFCWIVDFPMYEIGEESGELEFCHNPFSMPQGGLQALCEKDPLDIYAYQYDLVCNGVELSSGAVRNHDPEIMVKAFEIVGMGEDDVKAKFPAMYNAFCYGAPPHAGIAPGVDRMVMLLCGTDSSREVIAFPMNSTAQDMMCGAPTPVSEKQLREANIAVIKPEK
ncbi:MAG: Asp-tRNA(Asn)/Glu-tRNA(Gln) amidotransferase GatCAB subunit C, partial [Lachnospiraceae bacterium]|nr:Asp-tRNA(Asn)/Glu-tRNA(Gln) amidotransferase GatCAB subunit C [Lachnospiraceae bacterium]